MKQNKSNGKTSTSRSSKVSAKSGTKNGTKTSTKIVSNGTVRTAGKNSTKKLTKDEALKNSQVNMEIQMMLVVVVSILFYVPIFFGQPKDLQNILFAGLGGAAYVLPIMIFEFGRTFIFKPADSVVKYFSILLFLIAFSLVSNSVLGWLNIPFLGSVGVFVSKNILFGAGPLLDLAFGLTILIISSMLIYKYSFYKYLKIFGSNFGLLMKKIFVSINNGIQNFFSERKNRKKTQPDNINSKIYKKDLQDRNKKQESIKVADNTDLSHEIGNIDENYYESHSLYIRPNRSLEQSSDRYSDYNLNQKTVKNIQESHSQNFIENFSNRKKSGNIDFSISNYTPEPDFSQFADEAIKYFASQHTKLDEEFFTEKNNFGQDTGEYINGNDININLPDDEKFTRKQIQEMQAVNYSSKKDNSGSSHVKEYWQNEIKSGKSDNNENTLIFRSGSDISDTDNQQFSIRVSDIKKTDLISKIDMAEFEKKLEDNAQEAISENNIIDASEIFEQYRKKRMQSNENINNYLDSEIVLSESDISLGKNCESTINLDASDNLNNQIKTNNLGKDGINVVTNNLQHQGQSLKDESVIKYQLPSIEILKKSKSKNNIDSSSLALTSKLLEQTLVDFNVHAKVIGAKQGPAVTIFEVKLPPGVKISKLVGLSDDIALSLAASQVRVEAIPGKTTVGIEVPNPKPSLVTIREVIESDAFISSQSKLMVGLGKDISGNVVVGDLASMPHLLIAGSTGSGKSVCVNTIITSILYKATPDEVKFLMIDPKVVELSGYNQIPHLILPVVTEPKKAAAALNWAVQEMDRRYGQFSEMGVKDLKGYNNKNPEDKLPQIVVIIDELADLMIVIADQVEDAISRLAAKARAAGIHLIVATQRPSVDVITGVIKANFPSRIAFAVSSQVDSRTILDKQGAEKLLGKGDMLYDPLGASGFRRIQGAYISEEETEALVYAVSSQNIQIKHNEEIIQTINTDVSFSDEEDELLSDAIDYIQQTKQASASLLQRKFRIGYNRAARMIDTLEERGYIGPSNGSKPREVY